MTAVLLICAVGMTIFAVRDGSGELISVNTITVITVAANGTYTIEVYADTTFKVVAKEA